MANTDPDKRPQPVTMQDVARAANVSQSTVSRILSSTQSKVPISEETRNRVLAVIEQLGYHPNQYARSLKGGKVHVIGMMIADIGNPFYHAMVRAVQDVAFKYHYDVMIANSDHDRAKEELFCESIIRRPVDGIAIIPYHLDDRDLDTLIRRTGVVISAVGGHIQHPNIDVVYGDDERASYNAVRWLIEEKGHRCIAMICADQSYPVIVRRYGAFRSALEEAGLPILSEYVVNDSDWSVKSGQRAIRQLLALPKPPTAVFAANDTIAIGALEAAQEMGFRVPDDIAILGFDNIPEASWVRPRLTTISQHPEQIGYLLAKSLFERIQEGFTGPSRRFEVPCQLIVRESV
jgi:DNA-binding LacI/PurR family transcriptional regulator